VGAHASSASAEMMSGLAAYLAFDLAEALCGLAHQGACSSMDPAKRVCEVYK